MKIVWFLLCTLCALNSILPSKKISETKVTKVLTQIYTHTHIYNILFYNNDMSSKDGMEIWLKHSLEENEFKQLQYYINYPLRTYKISFLTIAKIKAYCIKLDVIIVALIKFLNSGD